MQQGKKCTYRNALMAILLAFLVACVPAKKLEYFNDIDKLGDPIVNPREQKVIMPFDNLYIRVISIDEKTNAIFNSSTQMGYGENLTSMISYSVDENGNVFFPFVGNINVGSLTTEQAGLKIQTALNDYISNTSVLVKFINNQVTVMGEVDRQGVYSFTQDKISIYEALGLGGGLTRYGDRKNIVLIRNEGDKLMHYRLNLTDSKIAAKDYYYVLPNDIIVVEPLKSISSSYTNNTYITILSSITTLIAVLLFTGVKF
jgi:polysaccharide biosynthesis/export protein